MQVGWSPELIHEVSYHLSLTQMTSGEKKKLIACKKGLEKKQDHERRFQKTQERLELET